MQKYKTVPEFLDDLNENKRQQVEAVRNIIFRVDPNIKEHIKWNAPSYVSGGEDRITFNLMNKYEEVQLVLHMGATRKEDKKGAPVMHDESGLVTWSSDIRGVVTFHSIADVRLNVVALEQLVERWLSIKPETL